MALLTPGAVAKRLRQFMGPDAEDVPEKLATLVDGDASVVPLDYAAHPIRLLATSPMERKWRARSCKKEPWTVAWIEESMRGGGVLYDVGANVGTFSLVAAKVCGRRGTVVAFEPGFASYAHLCGNIVLNRCEAIIIPVPLALAGSCGLGSFRYLSLDPGQLLLGDPLQVRLPPDSAYQHQLIRANVFHSVEYSQLRGKRLLPAHRGTLRRAAFAGPARTLSVILGPNPGTAGYPGISISVALS